MAKYLLKLIKRLLEEAADTDKYSYEREYNLKMAYELISILEASDGSEVD